MQDADVDNCSDFEEEAKVPPMPDIAHVDLENPSDDDEEFKPTSREAKGKIKKPLSKCINTYSPYSQNRLEEAQSWQEGGYAVD